MVDALSPDHVAQIVQMPERFECKVLELLKTEADFVEREFGHVLFEEDVVDPRTDVFNS